LDLGNRLFRFARRPSGGFDPKFILSAHNAEHAELMTPVPPMNRAFISYFPERFTG